MYLGKGKLFLVPEAPGIVEERLLRRRQREVVAHEGVP